MIRTLLLPAGALFAALLSVCAVSAQENPGADDEPFVVAVREVAPFAMRDEAGDWHGLSVDLWRDVADRLGIEFSWREAGIEDTLRLLQTGEVDAGIAALSVTGPREDFLDFSHPYYVTGLAQAFAETSSSPWLSTIKAFFSIEFLSAVGSLAVVLLAAGFCVWLFERRANPDEFGHGDWRRGLGDGRR